MGKPHPETGQNIMGCRHQRLTHGNACPHILDGRVLRTSLVGECPYEGIDVQFNTAMRTVSGALMSTKIEWLPILCNIAPPAIRRDVLSSRYFSHILATEIPAQRLLTEHPCCRLKSRKAPWNHAELLTGAHQSKVDLWRASWEAATAPIKHIVHDRTIPPPGFILPHRQWTALNRFHTGQGLCGSAVAGPGRRPRTRPVKPTCGSV